MSFNLKENAVTLPITTDCSGYQRQFVMGTTNGGVAPCNSTTRPLGILLNQTTGTSPAAQFGATVCFEGVTRLMVDASYAPFTYLVSDGTGVGTSAIGKDSKLIAARTLEASTQYGDVVAVMVWPGSSGTDATVTSI
jgi:hypothetical protein